MLEVRCQKKNKPKSRACETRVLARKDEFFETEPQALLSRLTLTSYKRWSVLMHYNDGWQECGKKVHCTVIQTSYRILSIEGKTCDEWLYK